MEALRCHGGPLAEWPEMTLAEAPEVMQLMRMADAEDDGGSPRRCRSPPCDLGKDDPAMAVAVTASAPSEFSRFATGWGEGSVVLDLASADSVGRAFGGSYGSCLSRAESLAGHL